MVKTLYNYIQKHGRFGRGVVVGAREKEGRGWRWRMISLYLSFVGNENRTGQYGHTSNNNKKQVQWACQV